MKCSLNFRSLMLFGGFVCLVILACAYFIEYFFHQAPCSLCLLQRYILWILCLLFFIAGLQAPKHSLPRYLYAISAFVLSILGLLIAARQIWIQHLPRESVPNCVADLERILKYQPLFDAISTILMGGGECHETKFTLLGLSLADTAAIIFLGLMFFSVLVIFYAKKRRP